MIDWVKESSAYQMFMEEGVSKGRTQEIKTVLLRQGAKRFGAPDAATAAALAAVTDLDRLERMADRILDVHTWQDLLATP